MKIYSKIGGGHLKTIPAKYRYIKGLEKMFENAKTKRLTLEERIDLEVELLKASLKKHDLEFINGRVFKCVELVQVKFGNPYYVAVFEGAKVRCSKALYEMCPNKGVCKRYHN